MHSHSKQPNSFFQTLQAAGLLQIGGTQEICKRPWPEAVSLLTLQPVIDNKNPRICCQHLCWLLQQGLTQLTSCLQRLLTFDQLPALTIVSSTDSHSVGSFSHRNVRPLSPVGRPSLLPAQNGPRRAHRAGTPVLAHFPRASAPRISIAAAQLRVLRGLGTRASPRPFLTGAIEWPRLVFESEEVGVTSLQQVRLAQAKLPAPTDSVSGLSRLAVS